MGASIRNNSKYMISVEDYNQIQMQVSGDKSKTSCKIIQRRKRILLLHKDHTRIKISLVTEYIREKCINL